MSALNIAIALDAGQENVVAPSPIKVRMSTPRKRISPMQVRKGTPMRTTPLRGTPLRNKTNTSKVFESTMVKPLGTMFKQFDILEEETEEVDADDAADQSMSSYYTPSKMGSDAASLSVPTITCAACNDTTSKLRQLEGELVSKQKENTLLHARMINAEENCKQYEAEFDRLTHENGVLRNEGKEMHNMLSQRKARLDELSKALMNTSHHAQNQVRAEYKVLVS